MSKDIQPAPTDTTQNAANGADGAGGAYQRFHAEAHEIQKTAGVAHQPGEAANAAAGVLAQGHEARVVGAVGRAGVDAEVLARVAAPTDKDCSAGDRHQAQTLKDTGDNAVNVVRGKLDFDAHKIEGIDSSGLQPHDQPAIAPPTRSEPLPGDKVPTPIDIPQPRSDGRAPFSSHEDGLSLRPAPGKHPFVLPPMGGRAVDLAKGIDSN